MKRHTKRSGKFRYRNILISSAFLLGAAACTYHVNEFEPVNTPDIVSFSDDIIPFFETSCATSACHDQGGIDPDLSAANAYASLINGGLIETDSTQAAQSEIYTKITTGSMSQYATDVNRALLLKWIQQGADNN
jgi:hypothetical protein